MFDLLLAELFGKDSGGVALLEGVVSLEVGFEVSNTHGIPSLPPLSLSSLTPFLCLAVDQDAIAQL